MMDVTTLALAGAILIVALVIAGMFASRAWLAWLDVRKLELANGGPQADAPVAAHGADRIELADLKARIRKLEAIASGIDL